MALYINNKDATFCQRGANREAGIFAMAVKVEICGVNTSKLPVYKDAQMKEMIEKVKQGDKEARDEFIIGNLRLVLSVIQKFNNRIGRAHV